MNKRIKYSLAKHKLLTTLYNYILLKKKKNKRLKVVTQFLLTDTRKIQIICNNFIQII